MKSYLFLSLMASTLLISGCGGKKSAPVENAISSQYKLNSYYDVNNESTYKPEELKEIPRTLDLTNIMTSVKDQGDRGTCSFFGTIALVEAAVKKKMKIDVNFSEQYLNYSTKVNGLIPDDEGGNHTGNISLAIGKKLGFILERDLPYQPSWFEWKEPCADFVANDPAAPAVCYSHNKPSSETMAKVIPADDFTGYIVRPNTFNDVILTLDKYKLPITAGIPINLAGMKDNGEVEYSEEMRQECLASPSLCGGHVITITGYDLDKEVFFFKNSWGKSWGKNGYGTLPFSVIDRHSQFRFGMISLDTKVKLPTDYDKDYFEIKKFEIDSTENGDKSIKIKTAITAENVGTHAIIMNTTLQQKKNIYSDSLTEENIQEVKLLPTDKSKSTRISISRYVLQDTEIIGIKWNYESNYTLNFSAERMSLPEVASIRSSAKNSLLLKTKLYVFTDEEGFKEIKTIIHPLNYLSLDL